MYRRFVRRLREGRYDRTVMFGASGTANSRRGAYLRLAVLTALAGAFAFALGTVIPAISAPVAAITVLISVRPTFHSSVKEGLVQVLGTLLGAAGGALLVMQFGHEAWVMFLALLFAFGISRAFRLGEEGAITIGVTVILVIGANMTVDAVESRVLGVVVGVLIAMLVSLYVKSGTPHSRALSDALAEADRLADLLIDVSQALRNRHAGEPIPLQTVTEWEEKAEDILRNLAVARQEAEEAVDGSRWSPLLSREEAQQVLAQTEITEAAALTVVNMVRGFSAAETQEIVPVPRSLAGPLSEVLSATAVAIQEQADGARDNPAEPLSEEAEPVRSLDAARADVVDQIRALDDTVPLVLGSAVLHDSEKISNILSGKNTSRTDD